MIIILAITCSTLRNGVQSLHFFGSNIKLITQNLKSPFKLCVLRGVWEESQCGMEFRINQVISSELYIY